MSLDDVIDIDMDIGRFLEEFEDSKIEVEEPYFISTRKVDGTTLLGVAGDEISISSASGSTDSPTSSSISSKCISTDEIEELESKTFEDNNTSMVSTTTNKKKRKSYYIRKYPIPKLLKRDIRWDIPKMVTNVLNSRDDQLVNSYFHRVCYPNCTFTDVVPRILKASPEMIYDIDTMINIINVDLGVFPDLVMDLKQAQIIQNEQLKGGCQIVLSYEMKGTKIFQNNFHNLQCHPDSAGNEEFKVPEKLPGVVDNSTAIIHHVELKPEDYVPLAQPMKLQMCPKISITLNELNIAYAIEYSLVPGSDVIKTTLETSFQQLCMV